MLLPLRGDFANPRNSRGRCPRLPVFYPDDARGYPQFPWKLSAADGFMPFQGVFRMRTPRRGNTD